ncbi:MFS transporter, partial [Collinsella tanakaei]|nr:MFS transporter [Collinsella tanakaei]
MAKRSWQVKLACVWGGELISVLTSSILQMGFIWHITLSTNSASMLSLASFAGFLPLALFGTFAGVVVDRLPLKRVLIGADLFIAAVSAVTAAASVTGTLPVWVVIVALFFRAIGSAFHTPAFQTLTPLVAPPEHLTRLICRLSCQEPKPSSPVFRGRGRSLYIRSGAAARRRAG